MNKETFSIRNAVLSDAEQGARVQVETWQSTYHGLMPEQFLKSLEVGAFAESWRKAIDSIDKSRLRIVAQEDSGRIIGFAGGGPSRWNIPGFTEELYAIYVHPSRQGKEVGRKLLAFYVDWLIKSEKDGFALWVLRDNNPTRRFYEATGGVYLYNEKTDRSFGGVNLIEVAYGWSDLKSLR